MNLDIPIFDRGYGDDPPLICREALREVIILLIFYFLG
jgi:hypothetical protein